MKIEIFPRATWRGKRWYFRVRASNGEIVAQSEGYQNRADCWSTAQLLRDDLVCAQILEMLQ
jgi:uncharacterized protein YegP (UPF0339 family)